MQAKQLKIKRVCQWIINGNHINDFNAQLMPFFPDSKCRKPLKDPPIAIGSPRNLARSIKEKMPLQIEQRPHSLIKKGHLLRIEAKKSMLHKKSLGLYMI